MKKFTLLLICLFIGLLVNLQTCAQTRDYSLNQHFEKPSNSVSKHIKSFPYYESFESNIGWHQMEGDDGDWNRSNNKTASKNRGPSAAAKGDFYMFLGASSTNSNGQIGTNATAVIESDAFDFSNKTDVNFTFYNHMYGETLGSLILQACSKDGKWTSIWSFSGNNGKQWHKVEISLNEYLGHSSVKLRFVGITGNGWSSDMAIDALSLTTKDRNPKLKTNTAKGLNLKIKLPNEKRFSAKYSWATLMN